MTRFSKALGKMEGIKLRGADLSGAVGVITEQLKQQATDVDGATMP
jgi:hypothetical protein